MPADVISEPFSGPRRQRWPLVTTSSCANAQTGSRVHEENAADHREHSAMQSRLERLLKPRCNTRGKEQSIKVYQVVRRGSKWHVLMPDASPGVHPSEDKSRIVAWTCEVAKKQDGAVQVRDIGGRIEMIYTYINGVEHHDDRSRTLGR